MPKLAFVSAVNNRETLGKNLLRSKVFSHNSYPLHIQEGFDNISAAYNNGMEKTNAEIVVFVHQDVYLPDDWEDHLLQSLDSVEEMNWGVLGVAGVRLLNMKQVYFGHVLDRGQEWKFDSNLPSQVDTLDELLLVLRNDGTLFFDEKIPSAHFYGADICLQAREKHMTCLAIEAYCHHNSGRGQHLGVDFERAENYMRKKWSNKLPFATTCALVVQHPHLSKIRRFIGDLPVKSKKYTRK